MNTATDDTYGSFIIFIMDYLVCLQALVVHSEQRSQNNKAINTL